MTFDFKDDAEEEGIHSIIGFCSPQNTMQLVSVGLKPDSSVMGGVNSLSFVGPR